MGAQIPELSARSREVLRQIVDSYVQSGEPIGSRTLARGMNLSPATIRNVMADLQDAGLLFSPHTSAGRLPTEAGLRLFVDGILEIGRLSEEDRRSIDSRCAAAGRSPQQALEEASRMLSGLGNCAGLVISPKSDARLKHIEFVALGPGRTLVVLVTEDGNVENRVIDVPPGLPAAALVEASNFLSARLIGKTIDEAQIDIRHELAVHRQDIDALTHRLVEAGFATSTGNGDETALIVSGTQRLLDDVEAIEDLERVRALYSALETKETWLRLLDATRKGEGVKIFIGAENELFGLSGCSMVVAPYRAGGDGRASSVVGALGVIGPTRMNYARIIPMVDYTARVVSRLLGGESETR
jgi:heat-inducible transcriptional repressor